MRVLLLPSLPSRDASSRYRVYKYIKHLEAKGLKCSVIPPVTNAVFDVFYHAIMFHKANVLSRILKKTLKYILYCMIIVNRVCVVIFKAKRSDVVLIHRSLFFGRIGFMELLLSKFNKRIVYDIDDALYEIEGFSKGVIRTMECAKAVIAGNPCVANYASAYNDSVNIIPTSVDLESYTQKTLETHQTITIGWIGNPSNLKHLQFIEGALTTVLQRYENTCLKIVCDGSKIDFHEELNNQIQCEKWELQEEVNSIKSFDIGIMPLILDPYTQGKCGFKLIQYLAVGLPVVCTPVGVNHDIVSEGVNGLFAMSEDEWIKQLSILIENGHLRKKMGNNGRNRVIEKYSIEKNAEKLFRIIMSVGEDVPLTVVG